MTDLFKQICDTRLVCCVNTSCRSTWFDWVCVTAVWHSHTPFLTGHQTLPHIRDINTCKVIMTADSSCTEPTCQSDLRRCSLPTKIQMVSWTLNTTWLNGCSAVFECAVRVSSGHGVHRAVSLCIADRSHLRMCLWHIELTVQLRLESSHAVSRVHSSQFYLFSAFHITHCWIIVHTELFRASHGTV